MAMQVADAAAMEALAGRVAAVTAPGRVIFLSGELGAGKTTFARGFLRARGHTGAVKSPTFSLIEIYDLPGETIVHVDLYRVADPGELETLALRDYLDGRTTVLVEWPERDAGGLLRPHLEVRLRYVAGGREVTLVPDPWG